jgi:hypothetical protein
MGEASKMAAKQKTASPTAEGSSMEKSTPRVGNSAPSKSNEQQPVTRNQNFTVKKLSFTKKSSGY